MDISTGIGEPLPRIIPRSKRLSVPALIATVARNPIEAWPKEVYEEPIVVRRLFGRDVVFVSDPDLVRQLLVDEAEHLGRAPAMLRTLKPALGEGLLTADGARWRWQRRAVAPIFRHERIASFLPLMTAAAERTRDRLLALPAGAEIDIAREMMRTTFDIIVETMLSGHGSIDVARVEKGVADYLDSTSWSIALNLLRAPLWVPFPGQRRASGARSYLRQETLRIVAERRRTGDPRDDLITLLLNAKDPETGQALSDRDLADNLLTFISAGHETTALALTWTLYLLSLHPGVEARVVGEIEGITAGKRPTEKDVDALAYTRHVLQEAMRLYPPAPVVTRAALETIDLQGHAIVAGSAIYVPVYAIHRHRSLWLEPDAFDPGRFLPDAVKQRHRYAYMPFGAGSRICIGMSFAMMEAVAVLATVLPAIRLTPRTGYRPRLKSRITLRPADGMPMLVRRR